MASELLWHRSVASRFDSPVQRLAIVSTAVAALLAALASSPPSCPMSVTGGDEALLAAGGASYERHFILESSASAIGVVTLTLESASVASALVHVVPDRVPDDGAPATAEPFTVALAPGVRHVLEFSSFFDGVRVRVELEAGVEVTLDIAVSAAQDDCHDNAFVKVVDG